MKNFVARHPLMVGSLLAGILYILALVLVNLYSNYYFFILIPGFVIWVGAFVFERNWRWVCPECGQEAFSTRNRYCYQCGGIMGLIKKEKKRTCLNNHYVDKWEEFCHKCGGFVGREEHL